MIQINAVLKKEWDIHKHTFLFPMYFVIGFILAFLILMLVLTIKMGAPQFRWDFLAEQNFIVLWIMQYVIAGSIALLCSLIMINLQNTLMNKDYENHFEVFHSCQPLSILKSLSSKMLFAIGGQILLFVGMTLFLNLSISLIMGLILKQNFMLVGLNAFMTAIIYLIAGIVSFVPLSILFSSIFKKKGNLFYLLITLWSADVIIKMANQIWGLKMRYLFDFFLGFVNKFFAMLTVLDTSLINKLSLQYLFSMDYLWKLLLGIAFLIASYFINKRRELS